MKVDSKSARKASSCQMVSKLTHLALASSSFEKYRFKTLTSENSGFIFIKSTC